jgi:hypothetical protein
MSVDEKDSVRAIMRLVENQPLSDGVRQLRAGAIRMQPGDDNSEARLRAAAEEYVARFKWSAGVRDGSERVPEGEKRDYGKWYPLELERQPCCAKIAEPTNRWPYSLLLHCCSAKHVAAVFQVDEDDLVRITFDDIKEIRTARQAKRVPRRKPKLLAAPASSGANADLVEREIQRLVGEIKSNLEKIEADPGGAVPGIRFLAQSLDHWLTEYRGKE